MNYNDLPGLRWSSLNNILVSPRRFVWRLSNPQESTEALRIGQVIHCAVLTPGLFAEQSVIVPDEFVTEGGALSSGKKALAWRAGIAKPDPLIATMDEVELCRQMRIAILDHNDSRPLLEDASMIERVFQRSQRVNGLIVETKAKIDGLTRRCLWDLKSYGGRNPLTPHAANLEIGKRNYHGQLGYYESVMGRDVEVDSYTWIFVSKEDLDVVVLEAEAGSDTMVAGQEMAEGALAKYAECAASGHWPGVAPAKVVAELPGWMLADDGDVADDLGLEGIER